MKEGHRSRVDDASGQAGDCLEHGCCDIAVLPYFFEDEGVGVLEAVRGELVGVVDSFVFGYAFAIHICVFDFFGRFELFVIYRPE